MLDKPTSTSPATLPTESTVDEGEEPNIVYKFPLTNFPIEKLPPVVRQRIWRACARTPQDVEVKFRIEGWWSRKCQLEEKIPKFISKNPAPAILHLCHESRVEGLRHLKLCFRADYGRPVKKEDDDTDDEQDWVPGRRSRTSKKASKPKVFESDPKKDLIYINPEIDTLFISFDAWCWPYIQAIQNSMCIPDDAGGPQMADFKNTWNKDKIESAVVYWERPDLGPTHCHSMMVFRQRNRVENPGFITVIRKFSRGREFLEPRDIDDVQILGRWDRGWEGVIQHLMCRDRSELWG